MSLRELNKIVREEMRVDEARNRRVRELRKKHEGHRSSWVKEVVKKDEGFVEKVGWSCECGIFIDWKTLEEVEEE